MKNISVLILFLFSIGASAQKISKVNSDSNLSDSLTYDTEVRIYRGVGELNQTSLFRMFKDTSGKWTAEFYASHTKVSGQFNVRVEKSTIQSENDMEFIFQNFLRSHIMDLPSMDEIWWKLVTRGIVEKVEKPTLGYKIGDYALRNSILLVSDGEGYSVQVKNRGKVNEFGYSNPESYLKKYPEIDELIYMCEILDLIKSEFHIWKE